MLDPTVLRLAEPVPLETMDAQLEEDKSDVQPLLALLHDQPESVRRGREGAEQ